MQSISSKRRVEEEGVAVGHDDERNSNRPGRSASEEGVSDALSQAPDARIVLHNPVTLPVIA